MKTLLSLCMALFLCGIMHAQVSESNLPMSQGSNNALVIDLSDTKGADVSKLWEKYINDFKGKTKRDKKANEIFSDDAKVKAMGDNTVDIYAKIAETSGGHKVSAWFDLGGAYISKSTHPEKYNVAQGIMEGFDKHVRIHIIEEELKGEEKTLKGLESDLKKLGKEKEKSEKNIADCEKSIEEEKGNIEQNGKDQEVKNAAIEAQQKVLEEVKKKLDKIK